MAPWMTGQAGRTVIVRYMPHHPRLVRTCRRPPTRIHCTDR
ncbi:hypothetical protein [Streptomyces tendae]